MTEYHTFIPMVHAAIVKIGIDTSICTPTRAAQIADVGTKMSSIIGPLWRTCEPAIGQIVESAFDRADTSVRSLADVGIDTMMIIFGAPPWATTTGTTCGPVSPLYYYNYADFVQRVVKRYPAVKYFQVWNEPDTTDNVGSTDFWGCWSDPSTMANMLSIVYPAIKAVRPDAQVMIGLGMFQGGELDWLPSFLNCGGGSYFDIAAFHHYVFWKDPAPPLFGDRVAHIRNNLVAKGLTQPIWVTETNLLTHEFADDTFERAKAAFWKDLPSQASQCKIPMLIGYSWDNTWNNCKIRGTYTEDVFRSFF